MGRPVAGEWVAEEFAGLASAGFTIVVSLLEQSEAFELGLSEEQRFWSEARLEFWSYEIPDRGVPSNVGTFAQLCRSVCESCDSGDRVVAHCRAGIGRSGLFAATIMILNGSPVEDAFRLVSKARGVEVPDTLEQVECLNKNEREIRKCGSA